VTRARGQCAWPVRVTRARDLPRRRRLSIRTRYGEDRGHGAAGGLVTAQTGHGAACARPVTARQDGEHAQHGGELLLEATVQTGRRRRISRGARMRGPRLRSMRRGRGGGSCCSCWPLLASGDAHRSPGPRRGISALADDGVECVWLGRFQDGAIVSVKKVLIWERSKFFHFLFATRCEHCAEATCAAAKRLIWKLSTLFLNFGQSEDCPESDTSKSARRRQVRKEAESLIINIEGQRRKTK
jgi:hypothetical protein